MTLSARANQRFQGQSPIVHLQADAEEVINWAESTTTPWAFTFGKAAADYTQFSNDRQQLQQLNWPVIEAIDCRDPVVKERKQAEFLLYQQFPWHLVRQIGVINAAMGEKVVRTLNTTQLRPTVAVKSDWHY